MKPASPYYTAEEAADYLRFPSVAAFYMFRQRHKGIPLAERRGGTLLFTEASLKAALDKERPAILQRVS